MTEIKCSFRNSIDDPLAGYILVGLDSWLMKDGDSKSYTPKVGRVEFTDGAATLNLAPSDLEQVTYWFGVWYYDTVTTSDPETGEPVITSTELLLQPKFYARVPQSSAPIKFNDLAKQSGINRDNIDTAISAITRRLYNEDLFWTRLQENLFVPKGYYDPEALYSRGDVITWDGGSYLYYNSERNTGILPSTTTHWQKLADRGLTGSGTTGNDAPFDAGWDGQTDAPSRNSIYDALQQYALSSTVAGFAPLNSPGFTGTPTRVVAPPSNANDSQLPTTAWVRQLINDISKALVPVGALINFAGTSAPLGWLLCDGRTISRTTYAALFAVIGTSYNTGGESGTDFRLPDFRGRAIVSPDNMGITGSAGRLTSATAVGLTGGLSRVTLSTSEIPSHSHPPAAGFSGFYGAVSAGGVGTIAAGTLYNLFSATGNTGGGASHENMPPYQTANTIIYTGLL